MLCPSTLDRCGFAVPSPFPAGIGSIVGPLIAGLIGETSQTVPMLFGSVCCGLASVRAETVIILPHLLLFDRTEPQRKQESRV